MALEIKLAQKLTQTLVMTPQLQQAIKLLQLGRLDYLEEIEREVLENPILESSYEQDLSHESAEENSRNVADSLSSDSIDYRSRTESEELALMDFGVDPSSSETIDEGKSEVNNEGDFQIAYYTDSLEYYPGGTGRGASFDGEAPSLEATVSAPEGLSSHILWQLRSLDIEMRDGEIVEHILGNLDRSGYLSCGVEDIALSCDRDVVDVERVLSIIQTLDPPGIAARDLQECLLIQLQERGLVEELPGKLVKNHLDLLEKRRYDLIAKAEKCELQEVYDALRIVTKLEPCPGRAFSDEPPIYITPDIYVRKIDDEYVIQLNESGMPRLRISKEYQELLSRGQLARDSGKEYVQDCLKRGQWLMKIMEQRQSTIYRVTKSIIKHQYEFLEKGISALKPLVLRDIAQDLGLHESTISRVTSNKYVHTPQGVFELKFFFSSGLSSDAGEVSSESVKLRIRDLISSEDGKNPLSDQTLATMLRKEGIDIARRTVAKYREMLNILPSSRRKKHF